MIDPAITGYLEERKNLWLKSRIKQVVSVEEELAFQKEAEKKFSMEVWVVDAAKRAWQLSLVSHPSRFSHPSAKTTNIIASAREKSDGFLRTGNIESDLDVFVGNAAALDVYKFLSLVLKDGKTILEHLEDRTDLIQKLFSKLNASYSEIEQGLLAIKKTEKERKTSDKVKQVYFPTGIKDEYHLLSILTPSALMFELKDRIRDMHFSDSTKEARACRRLNTHHEQGYSEIFGLNVIGYGGTKPQNISVLNSQQGGTTYLLPSAPPNLAERKVNPPRTDFFTESLRAKWFAEEFENFHNALKSDLNNVHVRRKRDKAIRSVVHQVVDRLWVFRTLEIGWSESDNYKNLPQYQKIWIDQKFRDYRQHDFSWFDSVKRAIARWFERAYTLVLGKQALTLADDLITHVESIVADCEGGLV